MKNRVVSSSSKMLQQKLLLTIGLAFLQASVSSLEHLRSYLLQDGSSNVAAIGINEGSLLLTASSDIVQKDLDTGAVQRTFRAHSGQVNAFLVISDNKMISSGWDDMIIMWDLVSGSVLKRIWLGSLDTRVEVVVLHNDYLYAGGFDKRIRKVDMITGKISVFGRSFEADKTKLLRTECSC
jgi:WD40 repeat protein